MWTDEEMLEKFEPIIIEMTHKCPRFWREDLQQELRFDVLKCLQVYDGQLSTAIVKKRFMETIKSFEMLERNRGMRDCPDVIDWYELERRAKEHAYTVRHVGNTTIFEKHV